MSKPTAFVLTHRSNADRGLYSESLQALAIVRSLGRRGVRVVRVHPGARELSLNSRYCWRAEDSPNVHESEPALLAFLLDLAAKYPGPRAILPASDDTAYFLGRHRDALSAAYQVIAPSAATVETIVDKRRQYQAAQALGIAIPETYFPAELAEVQELAARLRGYPYVIKPNVAHRWRLVSVKQTLRTTKGPAGKAVIVRDPEELVLEYGAIMRVDPDLMIQKVIRGADDLLYGFFGYFDRRSEPLGYCVRRKIRQMPLGFGYCTLIESCQEDRVVEQSIRLLRGLDYHGIVGVEWKRDPESGECLLVEINARATNTSALPPACGVDLPYMAFADAMGEQVRPVTTWRTGVKWIWFIQDCWAARGLRQRGELNVLGWIRSLRGPKVGAVYAADDLKPFVVGLAVFMKQMLASAARRLRRAFAVRGGRVGPRLSGE